MSPSVIMFLFVYIGKINIQILVLEKNTTSTLAPEKKLAETERKRETKKKNNAKFEGNFL
jgi:hypothetical protein